MITVDKNGNWKLYTNTIPENSDALGTVTRDGYDTGALVRINSTGLYVQVNAGAIRSINQSEVLAAKRKHIPNPEGRPRVLDGGKGGKRRGVYLDDESWQKATALGEGSPSDGIRKALSCIPAQPPST